MPSGRLAKSNPAAETITTVYTSPANTYVVCTAAMLNYGDSTTTFRLSILESANSTPSVSDFIEYDTVITSKNVIERSGIVIGNGQKIAVSSPTSSLIVNVFGIETTQ
jgi:hypothetical protein